MTTDELRDELARLDGWTQCEPAERIDGYCQWWRPTVNGAPGGRTWVDHPVPPTADAALAAFGRLCPGVQWGKRDIPWTTGMMEYWACVFGEKPVYIPDTGNFAHDLMHLTVEAVRAMKGKA